MDPHETDKTAEIREAMENAAHPTHTCFVNPFPICYYNCIL